MGEIVKKWYVIRAVSGKEKKVKEYLELEISRMKLGDYVNQILIPMEKVFKIQNGKKALKEKVFLPGYVIIEAALVGEVKHVIKGIPNVIGFLGTVKGGEPVPMRMSEVNRIIGKVDELAEHEEEMKVPFIVGEPVKVIDGPFNNFTGVVDEINDVPAKTKLYGIADADTKPYKISSNKLDGNDPNGKMLEFPLLTTTIFGKKIPAGGGFYLRSLPLKIIKSAIRNCNEDDYPATFYIHSWELTPEFMPKISLPFVDNFITYHNLDKAFLKMDKIIKEFKFTSFERFIAQTS